LEINRNRAVYCIGESLLDIVFKDGKPLTAKAGGSMLNTAVSLGRSGNKTHFISDYGLDQAGEIIHQFLKENCVSTTHICRYDHANTAIALAFLDEQNNAGYTFYKQYPEKRMDIQLPEIQPEDILLFGSFYALTREIREFLVPFVKEARGKGAIIIYDPNFRKSHLPELETFKPWIMENLSLADLVRGSDEDFLNIFAAETAAAAFHEVVLAKTIRPDDQGDAVLVYTKNKLGVEIMNGSKHRIFHVPLITPVSTIGAGDAFNAGIIHAILSNNITRNDLGKLDENTLSLLIESGIKFSTDVCMSLENYITVEFAISLKHD